MLLANALGLESRGCHRRSGPVFVRMKIPITGGCACGAIRYEIKTEPALMLKCHCRDCQQVTGSGYAPAFLVPANELRVTHGQLRYHQTPSIKREKHKRGFCPECGSRITGGEFEKGDSPFVGVLASSLDETVGPNGSSDSEIRTISANANKELTETAIPRTQLATPCNIAGHTMP
jgi:hypothetical protein